MKPSVLIFIHSFPGGQHTIQDMFLFDRIETQVPFGEDARLILSLINGILASNLLSKSYIPLCFLKMDLKDETITFTLKCARASERQASLPTVLTCQAPTNQLGIRVELGKLFFFFIDSISCLFVPKRKIILSKRKIILKSQSRIN